MNGIVRQSLHEASFKACQHREQGLAPLDWIGVDELLPFMTTCLGGPDGGGPFVTPGLTGRLPLDV
jgi:hypothetical protein